MIFSKTDIDNILEIITKKVLKGTHLPLTIKEIQAGYLNSLYFKDICGMCGGGRWIFQKCICLDLNEMSISTQKCYVRRHFIKPLYIGGTYTHKHISVFFYSYMRYFRKPPIQTGFTKLLWALWSPQSQWLWKSIQRGIAKPLGASQSASKEGAKPQGASQNPIKRDPAKPLEAFQSPYRRGQPSPSWVRELCGHFTQISLMKGKWNVQVCIQNFMFVNPPLLKEGMGHQASETFLLGIASNIKHWIGNPCLATPAVPGVVWGEDQFTKKGFSRNCIKCPELYRKAMFANASSCGLEDWWWDQFQEQIFARIE